MCDKSVDRFCCWLFGAGNGSVRLFLEDELDKGGIEIVANILVTLLLQDKVVCSRLMSNHKQRKQIQINKNENKYNKTQLT